MPRYALDLYVEIEADDENEAYIVSDELCTAITCGAGISEYWDAKGIKRLTYNDRGDGPILTLLDDLDD